MKYWWTLNKVKKIIKFSIIGLLMCVEIGCSTKQNKAPDKYGIDYSLISEKHSILEYDICDSPRYDYEATPLKEYLEEDIEYD